MYISRYIYLYVYYNLHVPYISFYLSPYIYIERKRERGAPLVPLSS